MGAWTPGFQSNLRGGFPTSPYPARTAPQSTNFGAAPAPINPGTTVNSPFGTQTYGASGGSTFTGSSATPASSTATPAISTGGYNPNTVYPGPYGNNADNYKVFLNNQNGGGISSPTAGTDPYATAGSSPYMALATGNGPTGSFNMGNQGFATPGYAQNVAKATGGTVNQATPYAPGSPFFSNQPQNLVTTGAGNVINPAVLAGLYGHGYSQSYVNQLAQNYLNGTDAYNSGVPNTLGQNSWGYNTNAPMASAQNFQAGTTPNAQVLAQNPNSIPNGFLGPGQSISNNPGTYTQPNPNQGTGTPNPSNPAAQNPNNGSDFLSLISQLMSPQVQNLYGGNPFGNTANALGGGGLGALLSALSSQGNGNGSNMTSIAALLNLFNAGGQYSNNPNLNPLFFNNGSQASSQLYYPTFY